jgi:hypothetical protein
MPIEHKRCVNSWRRADTLLCDIVRLCMLLLVLLSVILFANQNFSWWLSQLRFGVSFCLNDFAIAHIIRSWIWDGMWEKSIFKLVDSKLASAFDSSDQHSHWYVVNWICPQGPLRRYNLRCRRGPKMLTRIPILMDAYVRVRTVELTECIFVLVRFESTMIDLFLFDM